MEQGHGESPRDLEQTEAIELGYFFKQDIGKYKSHKFISTSQKGDDLKQGKWGALDESLEFLRQSVDIVASSNGFLLCSNDNMNFTICNPVTQKFHILPQPHKFYRHSSVAFICRGDQYQIFLAMVNPSIRDMNNELEFQTFCSKTGEWNVSRVESTLPFQLHMCHSSGIVLGEFVYWRGISQLVSYNHRSQELVQVSKLPRWGKGDQSCPDDIIWTDCLAASYGQLYYICNMLSRFELWVLEGWSNGKPNWNPKHSVTYKMINQRNSHVMVNKGCSIRVHPHNPKLLMLSTPHCVYWYNTQTVNLATFTSICGWAWDGVEACVPYEWPSNETSPIIYHSMDIVSSKFNLLNCDLEKREYVVLGYFFKNFERNHKTHEFVSTSSQGDYLKLGKWGSLDETLEFIGQSVDVVASSNGFLLCTNNNMNFTICNPVTREFISLPERRECRQFISVAFICTGGHYGTSSSMEKVDYQIFLTMVLGSNMKDVLALQTFSSKTGEWVESWVGSRYPFNLHEAHISGIIQDEFIYWRGIGHFVSYNMSHFLAEVIELPHLGDGNESSQRDTIVTDCLSASNGKLYYACNTRSQIELWLLDGCFNGRVNWDLKHSATHEMIDQQNAHIGIVHVVNSSCGIKVHPHNPKLLMISNANYLFRYDIANEKLETITTSLCGSIQNSFPYEWPSNKT